MHHAIWLAAMAFTYIGAAIFAAVAIYVVFWLPFTRDHND